MASDNSERPDRLAALHAQLTAAVEDLANSDAWRRMLETAARLPTYSPSNVLLIAVQRPDATRVAGFRTWKTLGRSVCKGEKGIAILAPCLYRGPDPDSPGPSAASAEAQAAQDRAHRELRGFRVVHVFDISQTEGEPLPEVAPDLLRGAAPDRLWEHLESLVNAAGFEVERGDCYGANGFTRFDDKVVRVRADVDPAQAVKTLAHELGHIRADHGARFATSYHRFECRGVAEIEAESIAYLITSTAGLDAGAYSVPYVTGWAGGDPALLRASATVVLRSAEKIEEELRHRAATVPERQTASPTPARTWSAARRRPSARPGPVLEH